jgi:hypothetical protein
VTLTALHKTPFPWFGGKADAAELVFGCPHGPHPVTVAFALLAWVSSKHRNRGVALLALSSEPVISAPIFVEFGYLEHAATPTARLLRRSKLVPCFVDSVFFARVPPEIGNGVVGARWVWMVARVKAFWAWADKCLQNKPVNESRLHLPVDVESNSQVPTLGQSLLQLPWWANLARGTRRASLALGCPNLAVGTDEVTSKPRNCRKENVHAV